MLIELNDDRSEKVRYHYPDYPIYISHGLLSSYPNYAAPVHWHDDIELIAVLSGEMQYNVNGKVLLLKENEGIFVNARQLHFGFSDEKEECDFICVLLHPILLCASEAYERDFVLPIIRNQTAPYLKLSKKILWQKEILEETERMYLIRDEKAAPLKVQSAFLDIWLRLYENIPPEVRPKLQNTDLSILKNMISYIRQNHNTRITLADIAAAGAVGQSKCCKLFAKYIYQTPNGYLTQYRLDKSTALLKDTDMSITEIAHAVGFGSGSYYAETFRVRFGKSPSAYRKSKENGVTR
ncbi:MAG TPA: AraC family transcriptional regulator [Clostridiales bacterium]|nr:AraC family transcriptional regulator [Clostridiales bacterium]